MNCTLSLEEWGISIVSCYISVSGNNQCPAQPSFSVKSRADKSRKRSAKKSLGLVIIQTKEVESVAP